MLGLVFEPQGATAMGVRFTLGFLQLWLLEYFWIHFVAIVIISNTILVSFLKLSNVQLDFTYKPIYYINSFFVFNILKFEFHINE